MIEDVRKEKRGEKRPKQNKIMYFLACYGFQKLLDHIMILGQLWQAYFKMRLGLKLTEMKSPKPNFTLPVSL